MLTFSTLSLLYRDIKHWSLPAVNEKVNFQSSGKTDSSCILANMSIKLRWKRVRKTLTKQNKNY